MNHIKLWWRWQKRCSDSILTKILVLLKIVRSPTMEWMRFMGEDEVNDEVNR